MVEAPGGEDLRVLALGKEGVEGVAEIWGEGEAEELGEGIGCA